VNSPTILINVDLKQLEESAGVAHAVSDAYVHAVEDAGGSPLVVPVLSRHTTLRRTLDHADGVLLVGGTDYRTRNAHPACRYVAARREDHDFALFNAAAERRVAILGICLGMQLINLATGGTIYEDTVSQLSGAACHATSDHDVMLEADSRLRRLLGERIRVNSSHHQSVKEVGTGMRLAGRAPDGVIEAIESVSDWFLLGVQWHPERMLSDTRHGRLWHAFVTAAASAGTWPSLEPIVQEESKRDR
jgi:putative glutamine amidotransferase